MPTAPIARLIEFPWVVVRFDCPVCGRAGRSRLVRLAAKYGADITLEDLLDRVAWTCPYPRRPPTGQKRRNLVIYCGIRFTDLANPTPPPPDTPGPRLRLVPSSDGEAA